MNAPVQPDAKDRAKASGALPALVFGSAVAVAFVGGWERDKQTPYTVYADTLAKTAKYPKGLPTNCSGLTPYITTTPMIVGQDWGKAKCDREDAAALTKVQTQLRLCFIHQPPQSVFDAATSHAWNLGVYATCSSSAMREWNQGQWSLGCERLHYSANGRQIWVFAGGKFVQGLANRRGAEVKLCKRDLEVIR